MRPTIVTRPQRAAERRAAKAGEAGAASDAEIRRLTAALAEMRQDRDAWRAQASGLTAALQRLKAPGPGPVLVSPMPTEPPRSEHALEEGGILHGFEAIGRHLGISEDAVRGRAIKEGMPFVRDGRRVWIRRSTLNAWLAAREAAAQEARTDG